MEVPCEVLQKLVCDNCGGYLSRGPVYLMQNMKYRCGRCLPLEQEYGTRIQVYEELAKLVTFPCRYRDNGCPYKVLFMESKDHEEACAYREYICHIADADGCKGTDIQTEYPDNVVIQADSSVQTACAVEMILDLRNTTLTVTRESSTAEVNSSNALHSKTTPAGKLVAKVQCCKCYNSTEPLYRKSWLCVDHVPKRQICKYNAQGCTYTDFKDKCEKHAWFYCQYSTECGICDEYITGRTLDSHYTQAHGDITYRHGAVCSVSPARPVKYLIIECEFGKAVCMYYRNLSSSHYVLRVHTPLPSAELYKYRCTVELSHPDTGHTFTCIPTVWYNQWTDWNIRIPRDDFIKYSYNNKINIKINISKFRDISELIL